MPYLDRRIRIVRTGEGSYVEGEWVPAGVLSDAMHWAHYAGAGSSDVSTTEGVRVVERATFTVRWDAAIYGTAPDNVVVTDEYGRTYNTEYLADAGVRRRFLTISCVEST